MSPKPIFTYLKIPLEVLLGKMTDPNFYQVGKRTRIIAFASTVGLGAVLTQQQGVAWRVVAYASSSL